MLVSIITNDAYFFRYAELKLRKAASVTAEYDANADIVIFDCDSGLKLPELNAQIIKVSRENAPDAIALPLPYDFFDKLCTDKKAPVLSLSTDGKHAILRDERVKLTSHEFALLSLLISNGDNYTSREQIAKGVWNGASDGLINIYIHYLREKLEKHGEKIIISSRKYGYKINPTYIGEVDTSGKENYRDNTD